MDLEELTAQMQQSLPEEKISKKIDKVLDVLTAIQTQNEQFLKYNKVIYNNVLTINKKINEEIDKTTQILPSTKRNINTISEQLSEQLTDIKKMIQSVVISRNYVDNLHIALLIFCGFECLVIVYYSFF